MEDVILQEPLTERTAVVRVDIHPGTLSVNEWAWATAVLGRPDITIDPARDEGVICVLS